MGIFNSFGTENGVILIFLLALGLLFLIKPYWHVKFLSWSQKFFLAAKFIPTERTTKIIRLYGAIFLLLAVGFLFLTFFN